MTGNQDCEPIPFDWASLVPTLVHPTKVGVIEALWRIGQPLSATDLSEIFDGTVHLSGMSYHLGYLAKVNVVVKVGERQTRGTLQKFYSLR